MIILLTILHTLEILSIVVLFASVRFIGKALVEIGKELTAAAEALEKDLKR